MEWVDCNTKATLREAAISFRSVKMSEIGEGTWTGERQP